MWAQRLARREPLGAAERSLQDTERHFCWWTALRGDVEGRARVFFIITMRYSANV